MNLNVLKVSVHLKNDNLQIIDVLLKSLLGFYFVPSESFKL